MSRAERRALRGGQLAASLRLTGAAHAIEGLERVVMILRDDLDAAYRAHRSSRASPRRPPRGRGRAVSEPLPPPDCFLGYTRLQVVKIMGDRIQAFDDWFYGQTAAICDRRHRRPWPRIHEPGTEGPHGMVYYPYDVRRFLGVGT